MRKSGDAERGWRVVLPRATRGGVTRWVKPPDASRGAHGASAGTVPAVTLARRHAVLSGDPAESRRTEVLRKVDDALASARSGDAGPAGSSPAKAKHGPAVVVMGEGFVMDADEFRARHAHVMGAPDRLSSAADPTKRRPARGGAVAWKQEASAEATRARERKVQAERAARVLADAREAREEAEQVARELAAAEAAAQAPPRAGQGRERVVVHVAQSGRRERRVVEFGDASADALRAHAGESGAVPGPGAYDALDPWTSARAPVFERMVSRADAVGPHGEPPESTMRDSDHHHHYTEAGQEEAIHEARELVRAGDVFSAAADAEKQEALRAILWHAGGDSPAASAPYRADAPRAPAWEFGRAVGRGEKDAPKDGAFPAADRMGLEVALGEDSAERRAVARLLHHTGGGMHVSDGGATLSPQVRVDRWGKRDGEVRGAVQMAAMTGREQEDDDVRALERYERLRAAGAGDDALPLGRGWDIREGVSAGGDAVDDDVARLLAGMARPEPAHDVVRAGATAASGTLSGMRRAPAFAFGQAEARPGDDERRASTAARRLRRYGAGATLGEDADAFGLLDGGPSHVAAEAASSPRDRPGVRGMVEMGRMLGREDLPATEASPDALDAGASAGLFPGRQLLWQPATTAESASPPRPASMRTGGTVPFSRLTASRWSAADAGDRGGDSDAGVLTEEQRRLLQWAASADSL